MDLRTFFGDWTVGQTILVRQGEAHYLARLEQFTNDEVVIKGGDQGGANHFLFGIKSSPNGSGPATYSLELQPGSGIAPSYFSGENLNGMVLLSSPMPSSLIVSGAFKYTSNTLITTVHGDMAMTRAYATPEQSSMRIHITHPKLDKQSIEFFGEI